MSTFDQFFPNVGPSGNNSGSFSGSFQGDGSKLTNILSSSYALTASYLVGSIESASYAATSSHAITAQNISNGGTIGSGSIIIDSTITDTIITSSTVIDTIISSSTVTNTTITGSTVTDTIISSSTITDTIISSSTLVEVIGSGSFSGSFVGDGSQLTNVTASYISSSNVDGPHGFDSILTSSYAITASYALNGGGGGGTTINPTDNVIPVRSDDTTFVDSPITIVNITSSLISLPLDFAVGTSRILPSDGIVSREFTGDVADIGTTIPAGTGQGVGGSTLRIIDDILITGALQTSRFDNEGLLQINLSGVTVNVNYNTPSSTTTTVAGEFIATGSLHGNASTSTTASYASTSSYISSSNVDGPHGFDSILSSSYAITASYALNGGSGGGVTINPTDNVLPVRSDATTFVDSPISIRTGSTTFLPTSITTTGTLSVPPSSTYNFQSFNSSTGFYTNGNFSTFTFGKRIRITDTVGTVEVELQNLVTAPAPGIYIGPASGYDYTNAPTLSNANGILTFTQLEEASQPGSIYLSGSTFGESISGSFTGSYQGDGSQLTNINTASYALTASYLNGFIESSSYALTSSHAVTAQNISNGGTIGSGSIISGSTITDTVISSSTITDTIISSSTLIEVVGSGSFSGSFVGDGSQLTNITSSIASTASYISSSNVDGPYGFDSIKTSSYALTASYLDGFIESSSYALTASYALNGSGNSVTSSYALTASYLEGFVESASYATTSSHALTASYLDGFIESASYAEYAATSSIRYDSGSGVITGLNEIKINDFDDNVGVTFQDSKLTLTFGSPVIPSISSFFNSGFLTDRFNQVSDSYNTIGNWDNGGYTFVEASILQGNTVLDTTTTAGITNLTLPQSTAGSQSYTLIYTGSSPLDGSEVKLSQNLTSNLSKSSPGLPSISDTVTVQLGDTNNQFEQGASGNIAFTTNYGASNGWDQVSITNTPPNSPISFTGAGSTSISIQSVTAYQSPTGENNPQLSTSRTATTTFSKIRSVRYGASTATSFTQTELEDLAVWDTGLGGTIGTIDKGNTNPSGDTLTITWSGDKYQYIIYDGNSSDLTGISTSGFGVIGQFTKSTVGDYTVYRTNVLQAGGSGASITYNLT